MDNGQQFNMVNFSEAAMNPEFTSYTAVKFPLN
ncbi:hypothetical protein CLU96_1768 [Chryseobacterium sp. 52]|nr:hypothetical protein CLU96_1768 [Chryseobacterium sp. 52]